MRFLRRKWKLTPAAAVEAVRQHATGHAVPWEDEIETASEYWRDPDLHRLTGYERRWFLRRLWLVVANSLTGRIFALVDDRSGRLVTFRFFAHRRDEDGWLLPLWVPRFSSVTIFWRMAPGEHYWDLWHRWWDTLAPNTRTQYRAKYPESSNRELAWEGFCDSGRRLPAPPKG